MTNIQVFLFAALILVVLMLTMLMVVELAEWMRETVVIVRIEK